MSYSKCAITSGMDQNSILICLFIFYFDSFPDDFFCNIAIWADDTALNLSCDKPSELSQQLAIVYSLLFGLKITKMQYRKHHKIKLCTQLCTDICEIILYLQVNPYRLKTKNIKSLIFVNSIIKYLMWVIFYVS